MFEGLRATLEPIERILNNAIALAQSIFAVTGNGNWVTDASWMNMLIKTIVQNEYLLLGLCLIACGFVIGILKRLISL